jgi:hypothetical protein
MQRFCRDLGLVLMVGVFLAAMTGCGGGKKTSETTTVAKKEDSGPKFNYEEFAPLPKVMTEVTLPMLIDDTGVVETTCFATQELEPNVGGFDYKALVDKNAKHVKEALAQWFIDDVGPASLSMSDTETWEIEIGNPTVMQVNTDKLRFMVDQECISDETGWLAQGTRAVTTIIGAKFFELSTKKPLGVSIQEDMVSTCKDKGITLDSKVLGMFKPALDDKEEQKLTEDGELIYIGPGGVEVPESKMPPESERAMKEWTLETPKPIYFAFQEIPSDAWTKENQKKTCDAFLVWGDVTPRPPECDLLKNITFTAEKKNDENIALEVMYNDDPQKLVTPYETTQKMILGNRIMMWINVKKEEEGVLIRTNSVSVGSEGE